MPKNRLRNLQHGAKSISIRTKNKIGRRRSAQGTGSMARIKLVRALLNCHPRDKNKIQNELRKRNV